MGRKPYLACWLVALALAAPGRAAAGACARCGASRDCQKSVRLVCEEKEVDVVLWGCATEDFAEPGPSRLKCKHGESVCAECQGAPGEPFSVARLFVWRDWIPNPNAKIYTKKKLLKKVVKRKVPHYRWVVEDRCSECAATP